MKIVLLTLLLFAFNAHAAPPVVGPDCGTGATVIGDKTGDKYAAGKVTLGTPGPLGLSTCTLTASWSKVPSCSAMLERSVTDSSVDPGPLATRTTTTTLVISNERGSLPPMDEGYVISYLCVGQ